MLHHLSEIMCEPLTGPKSGICGFLRVACNVALFPVRSVLTAATVTHPHLRTEHALWAGVIPEGGFGDSQTAK